MDRCDAIRRPAVPAGCRPSRAVFRGGGIERGCGLVQDQQQRILQQRPRDREALALSAREPRATFADLRVDALGLRCHEGLHLRTLQRDARLLLACCGICVAQVVENRTTKQDHVLADQRHAPSPGFQCHLPKVRAVQQDAP
jgi:hypothetical protein